MSNTRGDLVAQISKASSFADQQAAVRALEDFDQRKVAAAKQARDLDWADTTVRETFTPVLVHEPHTAATEWLMDFDPAAAGITRHAAVAEAAMWYSRVSDEVKADPEEFAIQAEGFMKREASKHGEDMEAVKAEGLDYLGFLFRKDAASGLDQIQQTIDPSNAPKTTPLSPETFDNFAPEVDPINAGVVGTETSERAPLLQEIMQEGNGQAAAEVPSQHSEGADFSNSYSEVSAGEPEDASFANTASLYDQPSLAINHVMTLDDFRREAASGLDQIQQTVDANNAPKTTTMPVQTAFPWLDGPDAYAQNGNEGDPEAGESDDAAVDEPEHGGANPYQGSTATHYVKQKDGQWVVVEKGTGKVVSSHGSREDAKAAASAHTGSRKQADMFGNSDTPHAVAQPEVANTLETNPDPTAGYPQGKEDGANGERPTFADASSAVPPNVSGYSRGYSDGAQGRDHVEQEAIPSLGTVSSRFTKAATAGDPDFRKGYAFASKWSPSKPLVSTGSAQFESGLYAGLSDSPTHREAWRAAHRKQAVKDEQFGARLASHDAYTDYLVSQGVSVTAATSTDLDTMNPNASPSPTGQTPINGPGTVPLLDGQADAAAAGGPSPYNGAEPFGSAVVPNGVPMPSAAPVTLNDIPGGPVDKNKMLAFRKSVQAGLVAQNKKG